MTVISKDRAYFLHQTPYRDNSALAHLFTRQHGKLSFVVSGLKTKKGGKRPFLQPCRSLCVDYQLRTQLCKLTDIDFSDKGVNAPAIAHFMFYQYANELLLTILPAQLPAPTLFDDYAHFLTLLSDNRPQLALRYIELALLVLFDGLPSVHVTEDTQQAIEAQQRYYFYPERGLLAEPCGEDPYLALEGAQLQAFHHIAEGYLNQQVSHINEAVAQGAKPLSTYLIHQLLNGKTLNTRKIYRDLQAYC